MARPRLDVDLFVKLSETKFILVAKAGMTTPAEHLAKFKAKAVLYLWVRIEDYAAVAQHSITVAGLVVGQKQIADISKLRVLGDATAAVFREAETCGFNETTYNHSKMVVEATTQLAMSQPTLAQLIERVTEFKPMNARHAISVSLVSTMIGMGHEWVKSATLEKLALGGMLHDIGKLSLPRDIVDKPEHLLSRDERTIMRSHPEMGRDVLSKLRNVPDDVILIVAEHHEQSDGQGYPRGLKDFQISPLARVVSLANEYVNTLDGLKDRNALRAYQMLSTSRAGQFNRDALRALKKMVEAEPASAPGAPPSKAG